MSCCNPTTLCLSCQKCISTEGEESNDAPFKIWRDHCLQSLTCSVPVLFLGRTALSVHSWCRSQYPTLLRGHKWKTVHQSKSNVSPSLVQKLFFKTSSYGSYSEASFLSLLSHMDANGMFDEICLPACRSAERNYHGECRPRVRLPACDSWIHHLPVIYQIWGKFLISRYLFPHLYNKNTNSSPHGCHEDWKRLYKSTTYHLRCGHYISI